MATGSTPLKRRALAPDILSAINISGITLIALMLGLILMQAAMNQSRSLTRAGVTANIPSGWILRQGVAQEELIYSASDPTSPYLKYSVSLVPAVPGGTVMDSVPPVNLNRGRALNAYKVLAQTPAVARGKDTFKVDFAYVQTNDSTSLPVVVRGVDYYFAEGDQVLLITLEEESGLFNAALPGFLRFVESVRYAPGGVK
ncbi:MAG TPA: hypothetical protein VIO61_06680 [Anaerolineaceae bacterium]